MNFHVPEPTWEVRPWPWQFVLDHPDGWVVGTLSVVAIPLAYGLGRQWRRRRCLFVERWSWWRLAFSTAALASLLAAATLGYYWRTSHESGAEFRRRLNDGHGWALNAVSGKLQWVGVAVKPAEKQVISSTGDWGASKIDFEDEMKNPDVHRRWSIWRFAYATLDQVRPSARVTYVQAPFWAVVTLAAVLPGAWVARQVQFGRRRRRAREGCCLGCGYDLRQTPQRCPECGLEVAVELRRFIGASA
jgi:hypothetical protein